jgi:two-component system, NarL family, invasion response regulator UvrY
MLILIAADYLLVRQVLTRLLTESLPSARVLEGPADPKCVEIASRAAPDVVVLDYALPNGNALNALAELSVLRPRIPVLVLSAFPEQEVGVEVIRRGASGFVSKDCSSQDLIAAVERCAAGGRYISDSLALLLALSANRGAKTDPYARLSHREREVFRGIVAGKPLTEIAQALGVSVKTIGTYRARILSKLNVQTNADLVRYAEAKHLALSALCLLPLFDFYVYALTVPGG